MRITRLYHPENLICGQTIHLDANTSSHLIRVLRTKSDTEIILFNGDGFDYSCKTLDINPKNTLVSIESSTQANNESSLKTTLIQGMSRHDRMDQTIQKSVELGVNRIIPVLCQRSNTKLPKDKQAKKLAHWKKVVISACEQSGRSILPEVTEVITITNIEQWLDQDAFKIALNPEAKISLNDISTNHKSVEIFIGPEGGFTDEELTLLETLHFKSIRFGPRILRTETTGPAVISALQLLWGDF
ncbi:MAG: 16S rRNA (uracil(1498)-N(3))-methyltransferase [Gammaproteobacteria bacterium]